MPGAMQTVEEAVELTTLEEAVVRSAVLEQPFAENCNQINALMFST